MSIAIDLSGSCAIVTGAAGGVGRATVAVLREAGAAVVAEDIDPAVQELAEGDDGVAALVGDVADAAVAARAVAIAGERFGGLDVLVNNAAQFLLKSILDTTDEEWDRLMRSNVRGAFVHARAALPALAERRGTMVNVASVSGMVGAPGQAAYAATKGAIVQLTRQLAVEFAPQGVRVNAVGPGAIDTAFVARSLGAGHEDRPVPPEVVASHPLGRVAEPREIAEVIAFVASPLAGFMTGAIVMADGGATAR
jgi:NAD(P)-dependent dehydrogenase (short-subunit alcohol dehydrogenase family)